jgi:multiple sugar transport system permease protein
MSAAAAQTHSVTVGESKKNWRDIPKHVLIMMVLAIELFPFYMMMQVSMKNNSQFLTNPWVPLPPGMWDWKNWEFGMGLILPSVANSVFVSFFTVTIMLFLAIMSAYFFARYQMPFGNILWAVFMFLMLMPGVANLVPLFELLTKMNMLNSLWTLIILGAAGGQVFNIFVLRNFIEDLPRDLFEAAEIDGASHFKQMVNVVLPMCAPIIGTLAILSFIGQWNDFLMPFIILRDKDLFPVGVQLIYLDGEYVKQWGKIMAAFFVASIPLIIIFLFTMKLFVRGLSAGAVKG